MTFTAIDFETAIGHHPCSVGIVTVENGVVVDEFVVLLGRLIICIHHIPLKYMEFIRVIL
jgi:DNA polymerase III epsilon subunit-like protein